MATASLMRWLLIRTPIPAVSPTPARSPCYTAATSTIGGSSVDTLKQGSNSVDDDPSTDDRFGTNVAAADLDNDGFTDLLVGTPYEDVGGVPDSGLAQVIWGSSAGLGKGRASTELTQGDFGRTPTKDDQLGFAVDATNELGSDLPMVAVRVPGGDVSGQSDAGWAGFFTAASATRELSIKTPLASGSGGG
jgi:hypothetical protein